MLQHRRMPPRRSGFALAIALATIVIIGALVAGIYFAASQEFRLGRNTILQSRATTAAEFGLNNVVTTPEWNTAWNGMVAGVVGTKAYLPGDGSVDTVRVSKISDGVFSLVSEGRAGSALGAQGRQRIGAVVTLVVPNINLFAALTTRGSAKVGGSSYMSGIDSSVVNWTCPPDGAAVSGLALPDTTKMTTSGCGGLSCLAGSPKLAQKAAAGADSTYFNFGGVDYNSLAAMAGASLSGGATLSGLGPSLSADGTCNTASSYNWGDPIHTNPTYAPCQAYFPIIHVAGDLHITGGVGQGILMVDGDLTVTGGFQFFGPVIVKGTLNTAGTGGHFTGGVLAANVDLQQSDVLGNAVIQYSSCAVSRAVMAAGNPTIARGHGWAPLY